MRRKMPGEGIIGIIFALILVVLAVLINVKAGDRHSAEKEDGSDSVQTVSDSAFQDNAYPESSASGGLGTNAETNAEINAETSTETNTGADEIYKAVLLGETQFYYPSAGEMQAVTITDVPSLFDAEDPYMKIWEFAVVDLDRDGEDEVILFVAGVAGDTGGKLILHQSDDKVYGYLTDNRTLVDLKIDGTFNFSDPTGVTEAGIAVITEFSEEGYTANRISYATGTYEGWDTFIVDHHSAAEEEYLDAFSRQEKKQNIEWCDFDKASIHAMF